MATISKVYVARNVLFEVLTLRGYNVSEYDGYSIAHVGSMLENDQLDLLLANADGKKLFVKYSINSKPNLASIIDDFFGETPILNPEDDLLLIVKDNMNESMSEFLEHIWATRGIYVGMIHIKHLQYNALKHEIVPKHVVLSNFEREELLSHLQVTLQQLPQISRYDPIALLLGIRPDMVCRIERPSPTAIHSDYYRVCI